MADDHEIFLEALRLYLEKMFTVIGAVGDGRATLEEAIRLKADDRLCRRVANGAQVSPEP